jgi:hypothetical protein
MRFASVARLNKLPARRHLRLSAGNGIRTLMKSRQTIMVTLLVIVVIAYFAVDIAYRIIELNTPAPGPELQAAADAPAVEMTKDPLEAYTVIIERNLFRTVDQPIAVDQMDPNWLEASTLQLDLFGTIAGEDGRGYAIIEEKDKKRQRLYKIGDKVGGATLVKVVRNAIVLRMGDRDQVLKKKETVSQRGDRRPVESPAGAPSPTRRSMESPAGPPSPTPSPVVPPAPTPAPGKEMPMPMPMPTPGMEAPRAQTYPKRDAIGSSSGLASDMTQGHAGTRSIDPAPYSFHRV